MQFRTRPRFRCEKPIISQNEIGRWRASCILPQSHLQSWHSLSLIETSMREPYNVSINPLVYCLAFISGFIIMSVELLGGRILSPYFGNSIYVWGSVITVFMVSLSIGYLVGGKLSLYQVSLRRYGLFFIIAATALLPTIMLGEKILDAVFLRVEDPRYGSLLASTLIFLVPTALLGMIAPYSVRLLVENTNHSGHCRGTTIFRVNARKRAWHAWNFFLFRPVF